MHYIGREGVTFTLYIVHMKLYIIKERFGTQPAVVIFIFPVWLRVQGMNEPFVLVKNQKREFILGFGRRKRTK